MFSIVHDIFVFHNKQKNDLHNTYSNRYSLSFFQLLTAEGCSRLESSRYTVYTDYLSLGILMTFHHPRLSIIHVCRPAVICVSGMMMLVNGCIFSGDLNHLFHFNKQAQVQKSVSFQDKYKIHVSIKISRSCSGTDQGNKN